MRLYHNVNLRQDRQEILFGEISHICFLANLFFQMTNILTENEGMHQSAKPKLFEFARHHRENTTQTEEILWEVLRDKKLEGNKFRRQHLIAGYILDFYCHKFKLAIEIDGGYHFSQVQMEYDKKRTLVGGPGAQLH